jgi:hypothetical protein
VSSLDESLGHRFQSPHLPCQAQSVEPPAAGGRAGSRSPAVLGEVTEQDDEAKRQIEEAQRTWLEVRPVRDVRLLAVLKRELGDGEAEAMRSPWKPMRRASFSTIWMLAGWPIASV